MRRSLPIALLALALAPALSAAAEPSRRLLADKLAAAPDLAPPPVAHGRRADPPRHLLDDASVVPSEPLLADRQWNLGPSGVNAFPLRLPLPVLLAARPVIVAVIDSGVDPSVPDLQGTIVGRRSFASAVDAAPPMHGTFVTGLIAARDDGIGLASVGGIQLGSLGGLVRILDLRVVAPDGEIRPQDEARAIHAAVAAGARVINLSFGAQRNPHATGPACTANPETCDDYSSTEAAAVRYAVSKGALVVAAIGNSGAAYADWPAALPHVSSVSAVDSTRRHATFSNGDALRNDLAAPGVGIVSTVPTRYAATGLSTEAGAREFLNLVGEGQGTSFSAPHVTAAAALLLALNPTLTAAQVQELLRQTALDVGVPGRDAATGAGELDVGAAATRVAFAQGLPSPDVAEPNDDAGPQSSNLTGGARLTVTATASAYTDPLDVYSVYLRRGQTLRATLTGPATSDLDLLVFRPGTTSVAGLGDARVLASLVTGSVRPAANERVALLAEATGRYAVVVHAQSGQGAYRLTVRR